MKPPTYRMLVPTPPPSSLRQLHLSVFAIFSSILNSFFVWCRARWYCFVSTCWVFQCIVHSAHPLAQEVSSKHAVHIIADVSSTHIPAQTISPNISWLCVSCRRACHVCHLQNLIEFLIMAGSVIPALLYLTWCELTWCELWWCFSAWCRFVPLTPCHVMQPYSTTACSSFVLSVVAHSCCMEILNSSSVIFMREPREFGQGFEIPLWPCTSPPIYLGRETWEKKYACLTIAFILFCGNKRCLKCGKLRCGPCSFRSISASQLLPWQQTFFVLSFFFFYLTTILLQAVAWLVQFCRVTSSYDNVTTQKE